MSAKFICSKNPEDFEKVRHEIDRVVKEACHGEFSSDDLKNQLAKGNVFCAYDLDSESGLATIVIIWEMVYYLSGLTAVNIMCLGGSKFKEGWNNYKDLLKKLWKEQGASVIQCYTSLPVLRLLQKSGLDIEPIYLFSRGKL